MQEVYQRSQRAGAQVCLSLRSTVPEKAEATHFSTLFVDIQHSQLGVSGHPRVWGGTGNDMLTDLMLYANEHGPRKQGFPGP